MCIRDSNIAFVPKDTTTGSYQTLEIDSTDQRLAWNPSNNRLQSYDTQTNRLITWSGGSSGAAGQVLTSQGSSSAWTWETPISFPSGTRMLFHQASAPTGWTKSTTNNDRALRVVSGTSGGTQGGDYSFSSRLNSTVTTANGSVSSHTLTESEIPSHYHYAFRSGNAGQLRNGSNLSSNNYPGSGTGPGNLYETYNITARNEVPNVGRTSNAGSTSGHNHGFTNPNFNLNVAYTDVIIAEKN